MNLIRIFIITSIVYTSMIGCSITSHLVSIYEKGQRDAIIFAPFKDRFFKLSKKYKKDVGDINIHFDELGIDRPGRVILGVCYENLLFNYIVISKENWINLDDNRREALVFHELGHCLLNRDHRDDLVFNTEISIMSSDLIMGYTYDEYRVEYIHELFTGDASEVIARITEGFRCTAPGNCKGLK